MGIDLRGGIAAINLATCRTTFDIENITQAGTTAQYYDVYGYADKGAWKIPAGTFGPNGKFSEVRLSGFMNIRNVVNSQTLALSIRITLDNTQNNNGQYIAGTRDTLSIPSGLTSRFVRWESVLSWNDFSGGRLQATTHSYGISSFNSPDANFIVKDTFDDSPNRSWDVDHNIYVSVRVQQTDQMVIGSRNLSMIAIP